MVNLKWVATQKTVVSLAATAIVLFLSTGCAERGWLLPGLAWPDPPPAPVVGAGPDDPAQAVAAARQLAGSDRGAEAADLLRKSAARGGVGADTVLYQLGLLLASPAVDDLPGAAAAFRRLQREHPHSPLASSAGALGQMATRAQQAEGENVVLKKNLRALTGALKDVQADLQRIVDIDLEVDRSRRGALPGE